MKRLFGVLALLCVAAVTARTQDGYPSNYVAATLVQLNDNGGSRSTTLNAEPAELAENLFT